VLGKLNDDRFRTLVAAQRLNIIRVNIQQRIKAGLIVRMRQGEIEIFVERQNVPFVERKSSSQSSVQAWESRISQRISFLAGKEILHPFEPF
jgi:hypothetical protein